MRIVVVGLDAAGKTTMVYQIRQKEQIPLPPIGDFSGHTGIDTLQFKNINIVCWDLPAKDKLFPLYHQHYQQANGVIYVVDSSDQQRLYDIYYEHDTIDLLLSGFIRNSLCQWPADISNVICKYCQRDAQDYQPNAKTELAKVLAEEQLKGIPLLVFANKQDLSNALSINEITNALELNKILQRDRKWHIQGISFLTDIVGIYKGLNWLRGQCN